ncbi:MAG: RNA polymerase sigma factor [Lachnospiraceae bacterium]|nr:RNA polymerase sigma factor [Lachnospiraceae bacterium]
MNESRQEVEKIDSKENFIKLIQQYQNLVFSICLKLTGDYFTAEDLTQETFLSAYRHMENFAGQAEKAWLCRIASNKCIDYLRAADRRMVPVAEDELPETVDERQEDPLGRVLNQELLAKLKADCELLKSPYRETAQKHFVEGMSAGAIAVETGESLSTVKTRIYRAREQLQKSFGKEMLKT